MKIAIDGSRAFLVNRTGIEEYSYQTIKHLTDFLLQDKVILYIRSGQKVDFEIPFNWKIKKLWCPRLWTQLRLSLQMLFSRPDFLFIPAHTVPIIHPKNTLVVIHGLEFEYCPKAYSLFERLYMRLVIKNSCKWASQIVCVSKNTKEDLNKLYNVPFEKMRVVYEGYNENYQMQPSNEVLVDGPYLFFVGRIEERKNIINIVKAFDFLKEKYALEHKLVLAGKPGYGYGEIKMQIENSKFKKDIVEIGYVTDENKFNLMKKADVFVFPSYYEGFGLPILEAQSCMVPVAASKTSSIPEVAEQSALYVEPDNFEELAENIYILIKNREAREDIIKRGYLNVKRFSWAQCAKEIANLLK